MEAYGFFGGGFCGKNAACALVASPVAITILLL